MAKRGRPAVDQSIIGISKALGTVVGTAESRWNTWKSQRDEVAKSLLAVRGKVDALLAEITSESRAARTRFPWPIGKGRRGRKPRAAGVPVVQPGMRESRKKRVMSAQTRAKMRAAAKARWAAAKKSGKKTLAKATGK